MKSGRIGARKRAPPPWPLRDLTPPLGYPPLLLSIPREGPCRRQVRPPPLTDPRPAQGRRRRPLVLLPLLFRFQGQGARRAAHIRKMSLVDSGASLSILPHTSMALSTGLHLVGANGKPIPTWGFRRCTVCFSGQNFNFISYWRQSPLLS
jgi:hypothetical protein